MKIKLSDILKNLATKSFAKSIKIEIFGCREIFFDKKNENL